MRRVVTLITCQARVFALKYVARIFVIESLGVPLNQREVFAVVFGVAARAFLARTRRNVISRMQTGVIRQSLRYLCMTAETLQRRLPTKLVAGCALRRSVQ